MITWDGSGWFSHGSKLQVIKPSDSNKFYKVMKYFVYIHDPQAKGSHFGPKDLEQMIPSYFHFIETRPSQAKPSQANTGAKSLFVGGGHVKTHLFPPLNFQFNKICC